MTSSVLNDSTSARPQYRRPAAKRNSLRVEPLAALEWATAIELPPTAMLAKSPAGARTAWVHRAPEQQVLARYVASKKVDPAIEAPWWLPAVADGRLPSRMVAFGLEDRITTLLLGRRGWVYAPWSQSGFWEYLPSEQGALNPTALLLTDRHDGWLDVIPAHDEDIPEPIAVHGAAGLRARIRSIEKL